jgi:hypothetical protein
MNNGNPGKKPRSYRGRDSDYPPPPLPWQVDPENNPPSQFGKNYKDWYDNNEGVAIEEKRPDLPKSVPAQVSEMVKKHMELVKKKLGKSWVSIIS